MLTTLSIRDVVLIDHLELAFAPGLCALTGETGAGKSILLDALGLALGSRAEARLVRHGCDQASVSARFVVNDDHPAQRMVAEHGLLAEADGLVLRRVLAADGRSRAYVNDQPVSVSLLRRLGDALVEVHGQFESQRLTEPAMHRTLLDLFGGLLTVADRCAEAFRSWQAALDARSNAEAKLAAARREEAFLRHAIDELDAVEPQPGEEATLAERRALLQNAEKLLQTMSEAARELGAGGGRGVEQAMLGAIRHLQRIAGKAEGRLDPVIGALERAASELVEAQALLDKLLGDSDLDPGGLEAVEERLFALRALARKHNTSVDGLCELRDDIRSKLAAVDDGQHLLRHLAGEEARARQDFRTLAHDLGEARKAQAARLDAAVAAELEPLRLGKARFVTRIDTLAESEWSEHGADRVAFEVATNPGVPPGPLGRIASGGELARFMLALKVVLAEADPIATLVFDEVDAGVGGAVAAAVGERLARLAAGVQVLVVTHSPQVAARGHSHWRIRKSLVDGRASTAVDVLDPGGRREEIARMLAGANVTEEARAAADSLLLGSAA
jgi:DNA repair protein RecN (Recombination protein N)